MDKGLEPKKNSPMLKVNPVDTHYRHLNCGITELTPSDSNYQMIDRYV